MIGPLLAVSVPGFLLGGAGMALANRRATPPVRRARWLKFAVFCVIVHGVLAAAAMGATAIRTLYGLLLVACAIEFLHAWRRVPRPRPWQGPVVAAGLAALAVMGALLHGTTVLVWCYLVTACADGFAQIVGQLAGRRALAPRLSPAKTTEGAAGGLVAAAACSVAMAGLVGWPWPAAAAAGAAVGAASLGGDLCASWVKRRAAIKDYSQALPGQGGFLDRFDSLVGALALLGAFGWCLR